MHHRSVSMALWTLVFCLPAAGMAEMQFKHHFGDRGLAGSTWGQTALADLDGDGDLDFITGQSGGDIIWYEYGAADRWTRHLLGGDSPSEVGGAVLDVNRDGRPDFVTGGAWYENPPDPRRTIFERHVFDDKLTKVHDVRVDDIDGDGLLDVVTMSDRSDVRWYKVSVDPTSVWKPVTIGQSVHSGICTGDMDSDGDADVVRSNVWFENLQAGQEWVPHRMSEPWGDAAIAWQDNATQTRTGDLNGDGRLDVVIADGENRNARIGWLEAPPDPRAERWITHLLPKTDTAARVHITVCTWAISMATDVRTCFRRRWRRFTATCRRDGSFGRTSTARASSASASCSTPISVPTKRSVATSMPTAIWTSARRCGSRWSPTPTAAATISISCRT